MSGWATKAMNDQRRALHGAYMDSIQSKGIECPNCKTRIFTTVKHPKTGEQVCPACGKKVL